VGGVNVWALPAWRKSPDMFNFKFIEKYTIINSTKLSNLNDPNQKKSAMHEFVLHAQSWV
jgi:hypothetical protein